MFRDEQTVAILFADICGSMPLFEMHGNQHALALIGTCIDKLAEIARAKQGRVIRSKGDDLLCTFVDANAALMAATKMMEAQQKSDATIHAGIHFGPVINARGDIFGDSVNVAARMLSMAKPGEVVVTEDIVQRLLIVDRNMMTFLGCINIKGKHDPLNIYSVILNDGDQTTYAVKQNVATSGSHAALILKTDKKECFFLEGGTSLLLGRSARCDFIVTDTFVSREHATISARDGKILLTDHSSTGTYVLGIEESVIELKRDTLQLIGSGGLSLGCNPTGNEDSCIIEFRKTRMP